MIRHVYPGAGLQNERRIAALHRLGLLDTPAEISFDRLTHLLARLLHVPVALMSLVDFDRQFVKSSVGLPEPWASKQELPLSYSFCRYVVESGEPLIIDNALQHPLGAQNLAIPELNIYSYIGSPLITADGMVLGALSAADVVPRSWTESEAEILRDLAAAVITEIELRLDILARKQAEEALYESNTRFTGAFQHASIGMALVSLDGTWLQVNQALCTLMGYSEAELLGTTFQSVTHPDDLDSGITYLQKMLHNEISSFQAEKRYIHKAGHTIWGLLNVSLVRDIACQPQYFVSQIQDITQRHQYEGEVQRLLDQLHETLDERNALLQQSNEALRRMEALYTMAETLNHTQEMEAIFAAVVENAARVLPAHRTVLITIDVENKQVTRQFEGGARALFVPQLTFAELWDGLSGVVLREGQGVLSLKGTVDARESVTVQQRRITDGAGSILVVPIQSQGTMLGTLTAINDPEGIDFTPGDMTLLATLANQAATAIERTILLHNLRELATIDSLTQLPNRRSWFEQSQHLVVVAERSKGPLSVIILDADHFKQMNDTYGHEAGDRVLQAISQVLQQTVRKGDVVGRYGGEEFVILLPDTDTSDAYGIAERVRSNIAAQSVLIDQQEVSITMSLGVATRAGSQIDFTALLAEADRALYEAKHAGRNCVRVTWC